MDRRGPVLIVCSNTTHADTFGPVAHELRGCGLDVSMLSLDRYYDRGATARLRSHGFAPIELPSPIAFGARRFPYRSVLHVWAAALGARAAARTALKRVGPSVIVVGNDRGLIEKAVLAAGRAASIPTVLVQDGVLSGRRPRPENAREAVVRRARRVVSAGIRPTPLRFLAVSEYGQAGCDVVCVSGPRYQRVMSAVGVPPERIRITGQPRYDRLVRQETRRGISKAVVFTTPFREARLGADAQERQRRMTVELGRALDAVGRRLVVKPHPLEAATEYDEAGRDGAFVVSRLGAAGALADADVAVIGISTVLEEAVIVGRPVIVPGRIVHGDRFDEQLPDGSIYPRFESAEQAVRLIQSLEDRTTRERQLARQRQDLADRVDLGPERTAAERVADEIARVAVGR